MFENPSKSLVLQHYEQHFFKGRIFLRQIKLLKLKTSLLKSLDYFLRETFLVIVNHHE